MNRWTDEEKNYVIKKFKEGLSPEEIHKTGKINRSKFAIELKIYNQIYDNLQKGDTYDEVSSEYDRTKQEIKDIEKKMFEMKNKSDQQTPYTGDGGYVYNPTSSPLDFSELHHINRTMNTVLHFYENISRLQKLKSDKIIDDDFYNKLVQKLDKVNIDKDKVLNSLDPTNNNSNSNTEQSDKKEDKKTDEKEDKKNKSNKSEDTKPVKKFTKKKDESDDDASVEIEIPVKKLKKRLI